MSESSLIAGKRVIVTGGSKGLGRALTERLANLGAKVVALARPSPELEQVSNIGNALGIPCDLHDSGNIHRAVALAAENLGGIDILVNNAGVASPVPFEQLTDAMINDQIAVNFTAVVHACHAAMTWLCKSEGHILNVSSETVRHESPFLGIYAGTKAAMEQFSHELRNEYRSRKVRVTILRSGSIATAISDNWPGATMEEFRGRLVSSGYRAWSGLSVPPESMAKGIINVLTMPTDLNLDIVEMRSGLPWFPEQ